MISQKLQDAINEQINREFYSEYLYLSMEAYCRSMDLDGFANFFHVQTQEEHFHGMKLYNFLIDLDGRVVLKSIAAPQTEFKSVIEIFEKTLEHEKFVTKSINELMDTAMKDNNHAVISFLKWFVDEQVEEEATDSKILAKLKLINGEGHGILMLDAELAQRTFTPAAESAA
ncbi:MAG: ferritin [Ignavibacteria bacterium]|jgi:ferritin